MTNDQSTDLGTREIQDTNRRNDVRILTPVLLMALIIVGGLMFFGLGAPTQTASTANTTTTAQR